MDIISGGMSIFILYWCILFDIVPRAPITTGMTTTLIFETFSNSVKTWYLSIFFCYLMALVNFFCYLMAISWSPGFAKAIIWHSLSFACWYKLCLVTCILWLYLLEYWNPKGFYSRHSHGLIVVCVCVCVCLCWVCTPLVTAM